MLENCQEMAKCAHIAYLDGPEAKNEYNKLGYNNHVFLENDGAQCHIIWTQFQAVLCFRGTEPSEFSDIKADLNALPSRAETKGFVHMGFQTEVEKIWDSITECLSNNNLLELRVLICGHSLGGAMATIAAARLEDSVDCLYTFGSPRAGSRRFGKTIVCKHYRHVNNNDIVPKVPFALMGYKHHGHLRYINHYGKIRRLTWWQRFKDGWRGRRAAWKKGSKFDGAYDHGMDYYVKYTGD
tara:strand:- start:9148 stop:9867 length:720 start_codon:yes stop_codon:yes gene_type:complete